MTDPSKSNRPETRDVPPSLRGARLGIAPGAASRTSGGPAGNDSDLRLVSMLIRGCESSWREFVANYAGLVKSKVSSVAAVGGLSRDGSFVDDLVAEVFAALLSNDSAALRAYAGRSSLATYLSVIAARVAIRKSVKQSNVRTSEIASEQVDDRAINPFDVAEGEEQVARLREAIERLPERQRAIVTRFHLRGMSYEQISEELAIPIGSLGPTLNRAQVRLRKEMEALGTEWNHAAAATEPVANSSKQNERDDGKGASGKASGVVE